MPMSPRLLRPRQTGFFLDRHPGARLAFSLRRLSSRYAGPVVRVRRSSDSAEQDFRADDVLNGSLTAWVGAGNNGFVRTWYDQSGNASHAQQATAANQPKVVNNGSLCIDFRGYPTILCDGNYGLQVLGTRLMAGDIYLTTVLQPINAGPSNRYVFTRISGRPGLSYLLTDFVNSRWLAYTGTSFVNPVGGVLPRGPNPYMLIGVRWINGPSGTGWIRRDGAIQTTSTGLADNTSGTNQEGFSLLGEPIDNEPYAGTMTEFLLWNDSRPSTFQQIDDQLIRHYSRLPTASNADAQNWIDRVYQNGGTVSATTAAAVNTFCNAIDAAGIRDRFYRLNLFCGAPDASLAAVRTPLFRGPSLTGTQYGGTTDTNVNFVAGDYAETGASGGLLGNGLNKYVNTGLAPSALPQVATMHLSAYRGPGAMSNRALIGSRNATDRYEIFRRGDGVHQAILGQFANALNFSETGADSGGLYIGTRTSATSLVFRRNNAQIASNTTSTSPAATTFPFFVFVSNASGTPDGFASIRMMGYSIGDGLTESQSDSYNAAMQAFQTALERQV